MGARYRCGWMVGAFAVLVLVGVAGCASGSEKRDRDRPAVDSEAEVRRLVREVMREYGARMTGGQPRIASCRLRPVRRDWECAVVGNSGKRVTCYVSNVDDEDVACSWFSRVVKE